MNFSKKNACLCPTELKKEKRNLMKKRPERNRKKIGKTWKCVGGGGATQPSDPPGRQGPTDGNGSSRAR
jgi:hypothetical protein